MQNSAPAPIIRRKKSKTHLCLDMTPGPARQLYGPRAAFSASTTLNQVTAVWLHTAEKPRINHVKRASNEWRVFRFLKNAKLERPRCSSLPFKYKKHLSQFFHTVCASDMKFILSLSLSQ
jgi:hypothetical protein